MQPELKHSRQRDAILTYLNTRTDHPTADMVYSALQETMPSISLGTVYRNLSQLADRGIILRISCDGKVDHFDAITKPHPHFFCRNCGKLTDMVIPEEFESPIPITPDFKGHISGCHIIYYGTCETCLETE